MAEHIQSPNFLILFNSIENDISIIENIKHHLLQHWPDANVMFCSEIELSEFNTDNVSKFELIFWLSSPQKWFEADILTVIENKFSQSMMVGLTHEWNTFPKTLLDKCQNNRIRDVIPYYAHERLIFSAQRELENYNKILSTEVQVDVDTLDEHSGLLNRSGFIRFMDQFFLDKEQSTSSLHVLSIQLSRQQSRGFELDARARRNIHQYLAKRLQNVFLNQGICRWNDSVYVCLINAQNISTEFHEYLLNIQNESLKPLQFDSNSLRPALSFGISRLGIDGKNTAELVTHAQSVGHILSKKGLMLNHGIDESIHALARRTKSIELGLARGIELNQLELEFQPVLCLTQTCICSIEALVRWHHPKLGKIQPEEFIPAAENTGLIDALGRWVTRNAFDALAKLHQHKFMIECSINCSTSQILSPDFLKSIEENSRFFDISSNLIEFEITESMSIEHMDKTLAILDKLCSLGYKIALDDFGMGYASLNHLRKLPLHTLKIDKSFIHDIANNLQNKLIVKAIIDLAHALGLSVQAEGIENQSQLLCLKEMGCDKVQGYWIAEPMSFEQLLEWLNNHSLRNLLTC